jgi:hypothetical protein
MSRELSALEQSKIEALASGIAQSARKKMTAMLGCLDCPLGADDVIHSAGSVLMFGVTKRNLLPATFTVWELSE